MRRHARVLVVATVLALVASACHYAQLPLAGAPNCPMMPHKSYWHADVSQLPVHPKSEAWKQKIGLGEPLKADFGSGEWDGGPIGIPYTTVGATQPEVEVEFDEPDESDPGGYPIPSNVPIEGGSDSDGDRHVLVVDRDACKLYETFYSWPQPDGTWDAYSGAIYDMRSNALRPAGWTSADAAGLPILPGLVRKDEVAQGKIAHAIRFTAPQTQKAYIWPARHYASDIINANYPPMGAWFRLRADFDTSGYSHDARVILDTLKKHGMILADNGSPWYMSGVPDEGWDNDVLHELDDVWGSNFEAVDTSSLMVNVNSGETSQ
jgi:hypothetical protein